MKFYPRSTFSEQTSLCDFPSLPLTFSPSLSRSSISLLSFSFSNITVWLCFCFNIARSARNVVPLKHYNYPYFMCKTAVLRVGKNVNCFICPRLHRPMRYLGLGPPQLKQMLMMWVKLRVGEILFCFLVLFWLVLSTVLISFTSFSPPRIKCICVMCPVYTIATHTRSHKDAIYGVVRQFLVILLTL